MSPSPLSPEIERDIRALEDKMRRRAVRRTIKWRVGGGTTCLWLTFALMFMSSLVPEKSIGYALMGIVGVTCLLLAIGLGGWGLATWILASENDEL